MSDCNKICIELPFNRTVSYSQRMKTKEFWNFLDNETNLKPYQVPSDKPGTKGSNADQLPSVRIKGMWHNQFKVFQEHGLDKAALAAYENCKLCSTKFISGSSKSANNVKELYEELQRDMQAFDENLNDKKMNSTVPTLKKYSIP